MHKPAVLLALALTLATSGAVTALSETASGGAGRAGGAPTTLPITSLPSAPAGSSGANAPSGTILMIKLYVGNVTGAERFYGSVFGAKPAIKVGTIPIVTFPKGGPGLVLLKKGPRDKNKVGGFIIQVPNLRRAKALAVAHGARVQGNFAGSPNGHIAQSIDLLDPWGNNVEILQLGSGSLPARIPCR